MQISIGRSRTAVEPAPEKVPEAQAAREVISDQDQYSRDAKLLQELQAEVGLYREIFERVVELTSEAANGNLEVRLLHCDSSDKLRTLARSINHLLDMTDAFLREAGAALEHASQGKFFRRVLLRGMRGTLPTSRN
jgi:hypothetical protein